MHCADIRIYELKGSETEISALCRLLTAVWPEHYGPQGPGDPEADLRLRSGKSPLPVGWVAVAEQPIGTVALSPASFGQTRDEGPWITGLVVSADCRGQGIGSQLVAKAETHARRAGFSSIFATVSRAEALFQRRGWKGIRTVVDDCRQPWTVMRFNSDHSAQGQTVQ